MDQLVDMGFPQDLAAKALAATGGKSTLTATEWILGQMESRNSSMSKHPQGRVDQFFASSSGRRVVHHPPGAGTGSSNFGFPAEEDSNVHWRTMPSSSMTASPGVDGAPAFERKRFLGSAPSGKVQDEDLGLSMFRKGSQGPVKQAGFPTLSSSKPRSSDLITDPVASTAIKNAPVHVRPSLLEPSNKRLKSSNNEALQLEQQEETPGPVWKPGAPAAPAQNTFALGAKNTAGSRKNLAPLAERMRPASVDMVVGQDHLLGPRCVLRSLIDNITLSSIIFWGPPGTGKTSLVRAIATAVSYRFIALSAVSSGLKEVREILEEAKRVRKFGERTLLFLDEIHRFNKAQQDAFLPSVEAGHIVFIGATTENPSFEINAALLSRCRVLTLNKLQPEHIRTLLDRAISDKERGLIQSLAGSTPGDVIRVEEEALQYLANAADGDARSALNSLEIAGLAAFAASESPLPLPPPPPRRPNPEEKITFNVRADVVANVKIDGEKDLQLPAAAAVATAAATVEGGVKQEASSSLMVVPASSNLKIDISGNGFGIKRLEVLKEKLKKENPPNSTDDWNGFGIKRLEVLKEKLKKENPPNSTDDYTKPFKRFVGGKEVVKGVKEIKERSPSGETQGDSGGHFNDVASKDMRERDGNSDRVELKTTTGGGGNHLFDAPTAAAGEAAGESRGLDPKKDLNRRIVVTLQQVQEAIQRSHVFYDKTGEEHYNIISALHKSMRGGDPDAAIYWLARMLEGGEGPLYVARRLIRFASEDVGLADPQALGLAVACYQACHFLGMPECNVNLAQCVTYLALAPKSVMVYHAIEAAQRLVKGTKQNEPVPLHLRNVPRTQPMKELGYGRQQPDQLPPADFMPPSLRGHKFLNGQSRRGGFEGLDK